MNNIELKNKLVDLVNNHANINCYIRNFNYKR